ncbi:FecR family protein [Sphingobacterium kyonggiense]
MHKERFKYLNQKFLNNNISESELTEYFNLLEQHEDLFYESLDQLPDIDQETEFNNEQVFQKIIQHEEFQDHAKTKRLIPYKWIAVACSIALVLGFIFYPQDNAKEELVHETPTAQQETSAASTNSHNTAIQLADGTRLDIKDIDKQEVSYHGVVLSKINKDLIRVRMDEQHISDPIAFHEFNTPKGTSYSLELPDGSTVQLNSGSSLKLKSDFNRQSREVNLSGEAYFDIAHNKNKPFKVQTKDYQIQVLGTQFNVKSYPQLTQTKTSLVKGSVEVNTAAKALQLVPGEQAKAGKSIQLSKGKANFREDLAWRDGYFRFNNASIKDIMSDISTWYNITDIRYELNTDERFTGSIVRSRSLKEVLTAMEKIANLKFDMKEGRVIVRN